MVHTDSSMNMENHSIVTITVLIILILEDIFLVLPCPALEWTEEHICTGKCLVEFTVEIIEVVVMVIVADIKYQTFSHHTKTCVHSDGY